MGTGDAQGRGQLSKNSENRKGAVKGNSSNGPEPKAFHDPNKIKGLKRRE